MTHQEVEVEQVNNVIMNKLKLLIKLTKAYPIIFNGVMLWLYLIYSIWEINFSRWIFDLTGASFYTLIMCFLASYVFKFCLWYRIMTISALTAIILEWVDINFVKINCYLCAVQVVLIAGSLLALLSYLYGKRLNKRNNQEPEKVN